MFLQIIAKSRRRTYGITFIEVLIAIAIAAIVSIGLYGSAIYTMRQTARNMEHVYAIQLANSAVARLRTARYDLLTKNASEVPAGAFEKQFFQSHDFKSDPHLDNSTSYTLTYELKGYGQGVTPTAGSTYKLTLGSESGPWEADEFVGHMLVLTSGDGANQIMYIIDNTASVVENDKQVVTVQLNTDPDGTTAQSFNETPGSSTRFAVDYGMYCEVRVVWGDGQGYKTITETVYATSG